MELNNTCCWVLASTVVCCCRRWKSSMSACNCLCCRWNFCRHQKWIPTAAAATMVRPGHMRLKNEGEITSNVERRTLNIERGHSTFDVRCSIFDVPVSLHKPIADAADGVQMLRR